MNRRGFLGSILAACAAPAIVRADALMRVVPVDTVLFFPVDNPTMYAGCIREISAYDISRDEMIYRFDVVCAGLGGGSKIQLGVDIRSPDSKSRDFAIAHLKQKVRESGLTPISGVMEIPDGVRGRFL